MNMYHAHLITGHVVPPRESLSTPEDVASTAGFSRRFSRPVGLVIFEMTSREASEVTTL